MMGHQCLYGMPVHSLKLLGKESPWPLGKEGVPGNSRNSPVFQPSPCGKNINDHQCPHVSVVTLSHFLPAGKRQKGSQSSSAPKFVNTTAVPLRLLFLFTFFSVCCVLADACVCHRPPLPAEWSCRQYNRSAEDKAAVERRDTKTCFVKGFQPPERKSAVALRSSLILGLKYQEQRLGSRNHDICSF